MKKLKLYVDDLAVESFEPVERRGAGVGTVRAGNPMAPLSECGCIRYLIHRGPPGLHGRAILLRRPMRRDQHVGLLGRGIVLGGELRVHRIVLARGRGRIEAPAPGRESEPRRRNPTPLAGRGFVSSWATRASPGRGRRSSPAETRGASSRRIYENHAKFLTESLARGVLDF